MSESINSREYWNGRFEEDWDSKSGREQSTFFSQLALGHFPSWFVNEVNRTRSSICDWGCAEGDGTALLADFLPEAELIGVDFAEAGIRKASASYPHLAFVCSDWLDPSSTHDKIYDVVFSSNTLEHFGDPWEVLARISKYCARMIVLLIPFQEKERIDEHFYAFEFHNIRLAISGDFYLAYSRIIESGEYTPTYWRGRQLLLIFLRLGDALWSSITLDNTVMETSFDDRRLVVASQRAAEAEAQNECLTQELNARRQELEAQKELLAQELEAQRQDAEAQNDSLARELTTQRREAEAQKESFARELNTQRRELEAQKESLAQELKARRRELEAYKKSLAQELRRARETVEEIMSSKSWRATRPLRWAAERVGRARVALRSNNLPVVAPVSRPHADTERPLPAKRIPPTRRQQRRVAAIMDTFTLACFEPECELVQFRPDNWEEILSSSPPDFLFVESAWNGNDGAWQYRVAEYAAPPGRELLDLLEWCRKIGIPTVFWNKEDPPHFDDFVKTACQFDWIFTTDQNCIPRYRKRCGHERVFALPFAAQPKIHNPVLTDPRNDKVCFAGTYYGDRFDARKGAMDVLLRAALDFPLDIYDRMHGAIGPGTENYRFPDEFLPYIVGRLEYKQMVDAYKRYRVFLNVNSVSDSETMFSRRVFELLACGTPVVSTESLGIRKLFPGIVPIARDTEEARAAIAELLTDDQSWRRRSALGIRRVMEAHTYTHRLDQVCETIGFRMAASRHKRLTLAVLPGPKPRATASQLVMQTCRPDRILLVRNQYAEALEEALRHADSAISAQVVDNLPGAVEQQAGGVVGFIDGNHSYGNGYVQDALLALDYARANSTSMIAYFKLADTGGVDYVSDLGEANVLSKRVKRACFVCRADNLSQSLLSGIFSTEELELEEDCYARSPFEFLAGAALEPGDTRMASITLEEPGGVAQT